MNGRNTASVMQQIIITGDMDKQKKPSNFAVAVHLAKNYRERMKSDEDGAVDLSSYNNIEWNCGLINTADLEASTSLNPVDACV